MEKISIFGKINRDLFRQLIQQVNAEHSFSVIIDSVGGMYNYAKALAANLQDRGLTGLVINRCYSAALLPFLACESRYCYEGATFYIHPVYVEENIDPELTQELYSYISDQLGHDEWKHFTEKIVSADQALELGIVHNIESK